jgi:uncharacterized membrane protein YesL
MHYSVTLLVFTVVLHFDLRYLKTLELALILETF